MVAWVPYDILMAFKKDARYWYTRIIDKINDCVKNYPVDPKPPSPRSEPPKSSSLSTKVT